MAKYSHLETDRCCPSLKSIKAFVIDILVTHVHCFAIPISRRVFARFAHSSNQVRYEMMKASSLVRL